MGSLLTQAAKLGEHDRIINVRLSKEVVRESFVLDHRLWHGASNGKHRHLPGSRMPARDYWPPGRTVRRSKSASLLHRVRRRGHPVDSAELHRVRRCGHGPIDSAELHRVRPCGHSPIDCAELYRMRIESRFHSLPRRHVIIISSRQLHLYCNLRDKTLSGTHQKKHPPLIFLPNSAVPDGELQSQNSRSCSQSNYSFTTSQAAANCMQLASSKTTIHSQGL